MRYPKQKRIAARWMLLLVVLAVQPTVPAQPKKTAPARYSAYLFTYFTGNDKSEEQIHFALSYDGYHYKALNGDRPILNSADISETGGIRDPHILRGATARLFTWWLPIW